MCFHFTKSYAIIGMTHIERLAAILNSCRSQSIKPDYNVLQIYMYAKNTYSVILKRLNVSYVIAMIWRNIK